MTLNRRHFGLVLTALTCVACMVMYASLQSEESTTPVETAPSAVMAPETVFIDITTVPESDFVESPPQASDDDVIDSVSHARTFKAKMNWIDGKLGEGSAASAPGEDDTKGEGAAEGSASPEEKAVAAVVQHATDALQEELAGQAEMRGTPPKAPTLADTIDEERHAGPATGSAPTPAEEAADTQRVTHLIHSTLSPEEQDQEVADENPDEPPLNHQTPEIEAADALDRVEHEKPDNEPAPSEAEVTEEEAEEIWKDQGNTQEHMSVWQMAGQMGALKQLDRRHGTNNWEKHSGEDDLWNVAVLEQLDGWDA